MTRADCWRTSALQASLHQQSDTAANLHHVRVVHQPPELTPNT
jgi:hypothetical protein